MPTRPTGRLERLLRYRAVLACAAAAIPAMAAAIAVFEPPRWLAALLVGLPAAIAVASLAVQGWADKENQQRAKEEERQTWRHLLRQWPIERMGQQDPYRIGVYRSRRALRHQGAAARPPYVRREVDGRLEELLVDQRQRFVLVTGADWVGKSRGAFEVGQRGLAEHRVLAPWGRAGLRDIIRPRLAEPVRVPVLLWIEDLSSLGVGGLTPAMLSEWRSGDNDVQVLAMLRKDDFDRLRATRDPHHEELRDVLAAAAQDDSVVTVPATHTPAEREEIGRLYVGEDVEGCLGDHLFRADRVLERFLEAKDDAGDQPGYAIALACSLANLRGLLWVPEALLLRFGRDVLTLLRPGVTVAEHELHDGLRFVLDDHWRYVTPLLHQASTEEAVRFYRARQVILDYVREHAPLPGSAAVMWARVLENVDGWDLLDVGLAAAEQGESEIAWAAWEQALESEITHVAGRAALELAAVLAAAGRNNEAERLLVRALALEDQDVWPRAARRLGELLLKRGNQSAAQATFDLVGRSNHPDERLRALRHLATVHRRRGEPAEARRLLDQVIASGHYDAAPWAYLDLGDLLQAEERSGEAEAAYRAAFESGHQAAAPNAAWALASYHARQGEAREAEKWHREAAAMWGRPTRLADEVELGWLLEQAGRQQEAETMYQRVAKASEATLNATAQSGRSLAAFMATVERGTRLLSHGDPRLAADFFRRANRIEGWPSHKATEKRAHAGLVDALGRVVKAQDPASAPKAAVELGRLHRERGEPEKAKAAFTAALAFDDREYTSIAALELADLAAGNHDHGEQLDLLGQVVELGHRTLAPQAALRLGRLHRQAGDLEAAARALVRARRSGDPETIRAATEELGAVRAEQGGGWAASDSPYLDGLIGYGLQGPEHPVGEIYGGAAHPRGDDGGSSPAGGRAGR